MIIKLTAKEIAEIVAGLDTLRWEGQDSKLARLLAARLANISRYIKRLTRKDVRNHFDY